MKEVQRQRESEKIEQGHARLSKAAEKAWRVELDE
jgi:hypothetical protein